MEKTLDANGKPFNRSLLILVLLVGTFVTVLNQTILATALPTLMKSLNESLGTVQWLTTGFMLVNGIMIPVSAWLSYRFNTKWLYLGSMTIFFIGTVMSYLATTFPELLTGRLIQAVAVGITMPLLQVIMLSIFPANKRGAAMGVAGLVIGLAPALGPSLSGWVIDNYRWQVLFGIMIPIIAVVLIAGLFFMKPVIHTGKKPLDVFSFILSSIGFGSLLFGFSEVSSKGWTDLMWVDLPLVIGVIFITLFVCRQLKVKSPLLEVRVFASRQFLLTTILSSIVMIAMLGAELVIPQYLQTIRSMSPLHAGLTLLPGALLIGFMSPVTGRIYDSMGAKRLIIAGLTILTLGTLPFTLITENTALINIIVLYAIRMFGISMVMMPATTSGMQSLEPTMVAHGTAVNNTSRQIAASMGTAVMISVLSNVVSNNMPAKALLKSSPFEYRNKALDAALSGYHAAFWIATGFAIVGLIVAFFLKENKKTLDTVKKGAK